MIILLVIWAALAGALYTTARGNPPLTAFAQWATLTAIACVLGALAIRSQPIGQATIMGRLGGAFLRWGFRAGRGQLLPATMISWLVWLLIGGTVITLLHFPDNIEVLLLVLAWACELGALFYLTGIILANPGATGDFRMRQLAIAIGGGSLILGSALLWFVVDTSWSHRLAVIVAGGPFALVVVGYGLFLLFAMTLGRKARSN